MLWRIERESEVYEELQVFPHNFLVLEIVVHLKALDLKQSFPSLPHESFLFALDGLFQTKNPRSAVVLSDFA